MASVVNLMKKPIFKFAELNSTCNHHCLPFIYDKSYFALGFCTNVVYVRGSRIDLLILLVLFIHIQQLYLMEVKIIVITIK